METATEIEIHDWSEIDREIQDGRTVPATILYRGRTRCGLRDAFTAVKIRERQIERGLTESAAGRSLVCDHLKKAVAQLHAASRYDSGTDGVKIEEAVDKINEVLAEVGGTLGGPSDCVDPRL